MRWCYRSSLAVALVLVVESATEVLFPRWLDSVSPGREGARGRLGRCLPNHQREGWRQRLSHHPMSFGRPMTVVRKVQPVSGGPQGRQQVHKGHVQLGGNGFEVDLVRLGGPASEEEVVVRGVAINLRSDGSAGKKVPCASPVASRFQQPNVAGAHDGILRLTRSEERRVGKALSPR